MHQNFELMSQYPARVSDLDDETFGENSAGQQQQAELHDGNNDSSGAAMMRMMMGAGSEAGGMDDSLPDFFKTMGTSGDEEFSRCVVLVRVTATGTLSGFLLLCTRPHKSRHNLGVGVSDSSV